MHLDSDNNWIGAGEDSAFQILKELYQLKERYIDEFPSLGIYRQVPISYLVSTKQYQELREDFQKGSIDLLIINPNQKIAVRVQGKKGTLKMSRERTQAWLLETNGVKVIDINHYECKELFKERVNEKSIQEVKDSLNL